MRIFMYAHSAILIGRNPIMKFNKAIVAMILAIEIGRAHV